MPASEEFRWNQKVLHIVFGGCALVMMVASVWLMAKDHSREWKTWQLEDRKKEAWALQSQRDFTAATFADKQASFEQDMALAQAEPIDPAMVEEFKDLVNTEDRRLAGEGAEAAGADFGKLDAAVAGLAGEATLVAELRQEAGDEPDEATQRRVDGVLKNAARARKKVYSAMASFISEAKRREKKLVGAKKFAAANRTAAVSTLGLKIGESAPEEITSKLQGEVDGFTQEIADLTAQIAEAIEYRTSLEGVRRGMDAEVAALGKSLGALETELARLDDQVYKNTTNPLEWVTRLPVLNALYDGNVRIDQIWLPDLTINYNFSNPARFDRCKSCHQGISKTAPRHGD